MDTTNDDDDRADGGEARAVDGAARGGRGVDLTGALGIAGHEVELLRAEDVADTAPVIGTRSNDNDLDLDIAAASGLRGMDAGLFEPEDDRR